MRKAKPWMAVGGALAALLSFLYGTYISTNYYALALFFAISAFLCVIDRLFLSGERDGVPEEKNLAEEKSETEPSKAEMPEDKQSEDIDKTESKVDEDGVIDLDSADIVDESDTSDKEKEAETSVAADAGDANVNTDKTVDSRSFYDKTHILPFLEVLGNLSPIIVLCQILPQFFTGFWTDGFKNVNALTHAFYVLAIALLIGGMIERLSKKHFFSINLIDHKSNILLALYAVSLAFNIGIMGLNTTYAMGYIPEAYTVLKSCIYLSLAVSSFVFAIGFTRIKSWISALLILAITLLVMFGFYQTREMTIYPIYIIAAGMVSFNDRKLVKTALATSFLVLTATFVLSMAGVIPHIITRSVDGFKHTFGSINPNMVSMHLVSIVIMYLYLRSRKNILGRLLDLCLIGAVAYFIRYYTGGRTSVVGLAYLFAGTVVYDLCRLFPASLREKCRKVFAVLNFLYAEAVLLGTAAFGIYFSFIYDENNDDYVVFKYIGKVFNTNSIGARLRISHDALMKYKAGFFGPLPHEAFNADDFVGMDVFYARAYLKYGIITLVCFLVFMTVYYFRLAKRGKFYKMYLLSSFSVIGITEALVGDIMYNFFPAVAFSDIDDADHKEEKDFFHSPVLSVVGLLVWVPLLPTILSCFRTIFFGHSVSTFNALLIVAGIIIAAAFATWSVVMAVIRSWEEKKVSLSNILSVVRAGLVIAVLVIAAISAVSSIKNQNLTRMIQTEELLSRISSHANGKVYVDNIPDAYDQDYTGISKPFFYGDELAFFENTTVITNDGNDYTDYFNRGFVYTTITDYDAVYTNDQGVIDYLENNGYTFANYCTYVSHINLSYDANINGLSLDADGSLRLRGPEASLTKGPYAGIKSGNYNMNYDLYLYPSEYTDDYKVCTLKILGEYGEKVLAVKDVYRSDFDEHGGLVCVVPFKGVGVGTEFLILMEEGQELYVQDMYYARTSSYDKRFETDARGNVLYEMYIDSDGNPYKQAAGYYAVHYEYDSQDHRILTRYLDADDNRVMITDGYCEYRAVVDKKGYTTSGSYCDTEGNPVIMKNGYFKFERELDEKGRVLSEAYFGVNNEPVLNTSGYHRYRRELDDQGQVVREEYYDLEDKPVALSSHAAGYIREYDENGNVILQTYLGVDYRPVLITSGYSTVRRVFDGNKRVIREEYYDENDDRIALSSGYSCFEREYDEVGNVIVERYYGVDDEPVLYNNAYWKIVRTYNEKKQNIHEMYYGTDDKIIVVGGGYAGADRKYDDLGRVIELTRIDENGKPVMSTSGYSTWRRSYNERNWITREEYYGVDGNPIAISGGKIAEEYGYDEKGNRNCYTYFGEGNERIMLSGSYWKDLRVFDDKKQLVHREFYDTEDKPVLTSGGFFSMDYFYDENGTWKVRKYYDLDGNLVKEEKNE